MSKPKWNFIHLLKKLDPVNDIGGMLYLVDPMGILSPRIWKELQFKGSCACPNKISKEQYRWTWCQSVVPNDASRDFRRRSLLEPSFRCLSPDREGEKCRPLDHTWQNLSYTPLDEYFVGIYTYIQQHSSNFLHVVCSSVSCGIAHLTIAEVRSCRNTLVYIWFIAIIRLVFYALVHTSTKYMTSTHVHSRYKQNSALCCLDFSFGGSLNTL